MPVLKVDKIEYTPKFGRLFKRLTPSLQKKVYRKTQLFQKNCFQSSLKTHKISKNIWSFSITGNVRILFVFERKKNVVVFIDIGPHSHVYKRR